MGVAYYGSRISPHIIRNPAGFLICKDVPIARTGTQKYLAREIGIPERGDDIITVYRLEEDVFDPSAISSFNGAPLTDEHPNDWVQPQNAEGLMKGTVTNAHRGSGKDSDLVLADIVVYGKNQIDEIQTKAKREISCGYECEYVPYRDGYKQTNIVGNHVALVSAGRAGERVAIKDAAEKIINNNLNNYNDERSTKRMGGYKIPRRASVTEFARAVGLKTIAQDAEPEEIMEMVDELVEEKKQEQCDDEPIVIEHEAEEKISDADLDEIRKQVEEVKDAIYSILVKDSDEEEVEEEEKEEVADDSDPENESGLESLDELEDELKKEDEDEPVEDDEMEEIEEHEVSPEEINDADVEEEEMTTDSIIELSRVLKPIIASIPDQGKRKRVADNLAEVLRKHAKKANDSKKSNYSKMINRSVDSSYDSVANIGDEIAKKFNPHYNKEVK